LSFLHQTVIGSHGRLKSSNCLIDSRWILKIADYGLRAFKQSMQPLRTDTENDSRNLMWTAPELLRLHHAMPVYGTREADVYSLGIILHEILSRTTPFYHNNVTPTGKCCLA
jgi:guanylate cyclase